MLDSSATDVVMMILDWIKNHYWLTFAIALSINIPGYKQKGNQTIIQVLSTLLVILLIHYWLRRRALSIIPPLRWLIHTSTQTMTLTLMQILRILKISFVKQVVPMVTWLTVPWKTTTMIFMKTSLSKILILQFTQTPHCKTECFT